MNCIILWIVLYSYDRYLLLSQDHDYLARNATHSKFWHLIVNHVLSNVCATYSVKCDILR